MNKRNLYISFLITVLTGAYSAAAETMPGNAVFTVFPTHTVKHNTWIIKDINPGQKQEDSITVKNLTDQNISLNISFREMEGSKENARIIESDSFKNIGNWVRLNQTSVSLDAYQSKEIGFTVQTPGNTRLGEYQGTFLVSYADPKNNSFNLIIRIGNRIYLNVTDNKILESNAVNLDISPLQISLIILSCLGLLYGLSNKKTQKQP